MNRTDEKKAHKRFLAEGMTVAGSCGLIANLEAESDGFYTNRVEYLCLQRLKENGIRDESGKTYTHVTYTDAVDSGRISRAKFQNPLTGKQYGYGLAQWTTPARKGGLYDLARSRGVSISNMDMQIDYLIDELKNKFPSVLKVLKATSSIKEASDIVLVKFEAPANAEGLKVSRAKRGQDFYDYIKKEETMTTQEAINKLTAIFAAEDGYLEKKSNSQLDSKTANAGSNNYTKYWRDLANWGLGNYQAQYWCAGMMHWGFVQAFGLAAAKALLLHAPYISCATLGSKSSSAGRRYTSPEVGDIVIFWNGSRFSHTGYVYKVDSTKFYTWEGNTSGGSEVISNGGGVCAKSYSIAEPKSKGHRFHRPDYAGILGTTASGSTPVSATPTTNNSKSTNIAAGQKWLNSNYATQLRGYCRALLDVDGEYGTKSRAAALAVWKDLLNRKHGCKLTPSNTNFGADTKAAASKAIVQVNSSGTFTYILQFILSAKGYYTGTMDGACGAQTVEAIKKFQAARGLAVDGVAGANTWYAAFN